MTFADFPTLIVEAAFNVGASTGSYWAIGDPTRGIIGTFTIGPTDVFSDITSYVHRIECTSGASSRVTTPLVEYEAGTASLLLDNSLRVFDPVNVASPFYAAATTITIEVPGKLSNAPPADDVTTEALEAAVTTSQGPSTNAPAELASVTTSAFDSTTTTRAELDTVTVTAFDASVTSTSNPTTNAPAELASVTVTAFDVGRLPTPELTNVAVTALDASVTTNSSNTTNAPAELASVTTSAFDSTTTADAELTTVTTAGFDATVTAVVNPTTNAPAESASVTASAFDVGRLPTPESIDVDVTANDATVITINHPVTNAAAENAAVTTRGFNATVTGTGSRPIPDGMMFGASGGNSIPNMITALSPAVVRCYEQLPASYANTGDMSKVPASIRQYCSFKPDISSFANSSSAGYPTIVRNIKAVLRGLSDIAGHAVIIHHEPIHEALDLNPPTFTAAEWRAAYINCRNDVVDPVNNGEASHPAGRTHPVFLVACTEGSRTNAEQDQFFTTAVCDVLDEINWDCYGFAQGGDIQFTRLHAYAKAKGLPYSVGELGYSTGTNGAVATDDQYKLCMTTIVNDIAGFPASERPIAVMWFDQGLNNLIGFPKATGFWRSTCINTSIDPTV